jgi:hypothetical protein
LSTLRSKTIRFAWMYSGSGTLRMAAVISDSWGLDVNPSDSKGERQ